MTKRKQSVWIIEIFFDRGLYQGWTPTVGIALMRDDARLVLRDWQRRNPDDKFRLTQYAALSKRRRKP